MMNSELKKISIVIFTIYFPPVISIASYRLEAFAKYLDKEKFEITVICPEKESDHNVQDINSINIRRLKYKPHPLKIIFNKKDTFIVHKIKALYNRIFSIFIHDEYKDWEKEAIKAFKKIDAIRKTDKVLSSFPTVAPHAVALKLKMEGADFKWIADMRDEMSLNPFNNSLQKMYLSKIEKRLFEKADLITTTTPSLVGAFRKLAGGKPDIEFKVAGMKKCKKYHLPENISFLGWVENMKPLYKNSVLCLRLTVHDGLPFFVLEAVNNYRYVSFMQRYEPCHFI